MGLLTEVEVREIAEELEEGGGVRVIEYEVGSKSSEVHGYLGKHLTLTLSLASGRGAGISRRRLFLKTYEVKSNQIDFLGETGIFQREQDFYGIVVADVRKLLGVPEWCPRYYFGKRRVLVLEDLSEKSFKMVEGEQSQWALDGAHLEKALGALASMHAASLSMEHRQSDSLPVLYPTIFGKEMLYDESKPEAPSRKWITWQIEDLLQGVDHLDKYSAREKAIIKNNFEKQVMRVYPLSKKSTKYRNVLTHGDMWRNNLLFRYSDEHLPEACKLVDFQFIRYAPPAHDVMHLLHFATKKEMRDRREIHFLSFYYRNLKKRGRDNGVEVERDLTEEQFLESCKEYKELALIQCLLSLHYTLGKVNLNPDAESNEKYEDYLANSRKEYMTKFFQEESYAEKIKDVFHELIDTYIINQ